MQGMSLLEKYYMLHEKCASPKTSDCSRSTIYYFDKFCKHCNGGMKRPEKHERRILKQLWKAGFCSRDCVLNGKRQWKTFSPSASDSHVVNKQNPDLENMVGLSMVIDKKIEQMHPTAKIVKQADIRFNMLSEKLSFLEDVTGQKWYSSKFYFWLEKSVY
jgi:hypothetical protein